MKPTGKKAAAETGLLREPSAPITIPDHELLRSIGRGSYGEVWLARHSLGAYRAVKVVHRHSFKDSKPFERELSGIRKFEPISRSHPGFVDILHVGMDEAAGYLYYVMEIGDDLSGSRSIEPDDYTPKTLSREIGRRGRLSIDELLQLGLVLCDALGELEKNGLVHRDIKPSNIIYVDGVAKLADIGLVAAINEAPSGVGTEGFIPPEGPGTAQADIFALGKTLYEASTGRDRLDFPELPTHWDQSSQQERLLEVNEIVLQACARETSKRYPSAMRMHADLLAVSKGESVRRLKQLERSLVRLRRIAGIAGIVVMIVAGIGYHFYREWANSRQARQQKVGASVAYGNRAMDLSDLSAAGSYFADAWRLEEGDPSREKSHWLRFNSVLEQSPKIVQMWFGPTELKTARFSPVREQILAVELRGQAKILDLATGKTFSHPSAGGDDGLCNGSWSPDGNLVVTANRDDLVSVWKASDGSSVRRLEGTKGAECASFSPDGSRLIVGCTNGYIVKVWDTRSWEVVLKLPGHTNVVLFAGFSRDGHRIITTGRDNTARLWDATSGLQSPSEFPHPSWVYYAALSPDGATLVTACFDRKVRFWNATTGQQIPPALAHPDGISSVDFSPDGRLIVSGGMDNAARIWLADTHQPYSPAPLLRHSFRVLHAEFCSDGHRIVTACADGTLRLWDLAGSAVPPPMLRYTFSEDKTRFLTLTNNALQVWDTASRAAVSKPMKPEGIVEQQQLSPDGRFVASLSASPEASASAARTLEVWETSTGVRAGRPFPFSNGLANLTLSRDGTRFVTFTGKTVRTGNILSGEFFPQQVLYEYEVDSAVLSPGGDRVASSSRGTVKVSDVASGELCFRELFEPFFLTRAQFSPDGSSLITYGWDQAFTRCSAQVWNARNGQTNGLPIRHGDGINWASFSPDGRRVVTASEDRSAIVWDAATGRQLTPRMTHDDEVETASFSANGLWIVTASRDKTARVWSAQTGEPLTPPLRHLVPLVDARFLANGRAVVASDRAGNAWVWELPVDKRPLDDCLSIARLLSGDSVATSDEMATRDSTLLPLVWDRVRAHSPEVLTVSTNQIAAWHDFEAQKSEMEHRWDAVVFHLGRYQAIFPNDPLIAQRLDQARKNLHE